MSELYFLAVPINMVYRLVDQEASLMFGLQYKCKYIKLSHSKDQNNHLTSHPTSRPQMFLQPTPERIEQQPIYPDQKPLHQPHPQPINPQIPPPPTTQPLQYMMDFVPPPINDSSKYHDQLQNDFLQTLSKNPVGLDYLMLFGEKRPLDIQQKKLPEPIFVDSVTKTKMKKIVRSVYERMIENLKYCAGELPINQGSPLPKIQEKAHEFMMFCEQVQVAETKTVIWKLMQEETKQMNQKAQEIQEFIEGMEGYCKNQQEKEGFE